MILFFDFLSTKPNLKINKKVRLKNISSGLASLIAIMMIVSISLYFSTQLIVRENSSIIFNSVPNYEEKLNLSELPYMIGLFTNLGTPIQDSENIFYIQSEIWNMYYDKTEGKSKQVAERITIKQEKCDIDKHFGKYRDYFKELPDISSYLCPIPEQNNITIFRQFSTESIFIGHYIARCVNNTALNRTCKDPATIQSSLANTYVTYKFFEYSINHKNITSPGYLSLRSDGLSVSSSIFTRYWYYLKTITYSSDMGFIFEDLVIQNYFEVSRAVQNVNLNFQGTVPGSFALISLTMDYKSDFYHRSFLKAQSLLANIGGMIKGILLIFEIIFYYTNTELYYYEIISSFFKIKSEQNSIEIPNLNNRLVYLFI